MKNKPEKLFRINKTSEKQTQNKPKQTRALAIGDEVSHLESMKPSGSAENKPKTNLNRPETLETETNLVEC